jgi:small GTP-binding protein
MAERNPRFQLLTPRGHGGVAVVTVRGADRWARVEPFVALRSPRGADAGPRLGVLRGEGVDLDEVLLVDRPAARVLEIHLHGSPAVVREFERVVGGFATADPGRAEGLVRGARSREQLAFALEQRGFDLDGFLAGSPGSAELEAALRRSRIALALTQPRRLVICGDQNAGKSTLMNRLLFRERVVTGDIPGLTRDPVAEGTLLDGYPYEVVDTAGEGPAGAGATGAVDRLALRLARHERRDGLLLLVVDGSETPSGSDRRIRNEYTLVVRSKSDRPAMAWPLDFAADVTLSCLEADSAPVARAAVGAALRRLRDLPPAGPVGGVAAVSEEERARLAAACDGP